MAKYTFTCPLPGCSQIMASNADNADGAAMELTAKAEQHLKDVHPDVSKTHEEVDADIRSHMVANG